MPALIRLIAAISLILITASTLAQPPKDRVPVDTVIKTITVHDTVYLHDTVVGLANNINVEQGRAVVASPCDSVHRHLALEDRVLEDKKDWLTYLFTIVTILVAFVGIFAPIMFFQTLSSRRKAIKEAREAGDRIDKLWAELRKDRREMLKEAKEKVQTTVAEIKTKCETSVGEIDAAVIKAQQKLERILAISARMESLDQRIGAPQLDIEERAKLIEEADAEDAVKQYEALLAQLESDGLSQEMVPASLRDKMAESYYRLGQYEKSLDEVSAFVAQSPQNPRAINNLGLVLGGRYGNTGEVDWLKQAFEKYDEATTLKPDYADAYYNWANDLGKMYTATHNIVWLEQAIEKYERAADLRTDFHRAFNNWGTALEGMYQSTNEPKWLSLAIEKYETATAITPDDYKPYSNWGNALGRMYDATQELSWLEQALEKYEKSTTIKPDAADALFNWGYALGSMFVATGERKWLKQSIEKYEEAKKTEPHNHKALANLGASLTSMYIATGMTKWLEKALKNFEAAATLRSDDHTPLDYWSNSLIHMYHATGRSEFLEQALEKSSQALHIAPEMKGCNYNAACAYALMEKKDEMLVALKKAVDFGSKFKKQAREDKDFEKYWTDPEFIALTRENTGDSAEPEKPE